MTTPDAQGFLMGNSIPGAPMKDIGTTVGGTITEDPSMQQQRDFTTGELKVWSDGGAQMQLVVTVQTQLRDPEITEDDGRRRFYIKGELKKAVSTAVRQARADGLAVGGTLTVTYTGDGTASGRGMNPPKLYSAAYVAPTAAAAAGFLSDGFTPDTTPAPAAAPGGFPHVAAGPGRPANIPEAVWATLTPEAKAAMAQLQKA